MTVPVPPPHDLEQPLARVESQLAALALALRSSDATALETAASELHQALAAAVEHFRRAARTGHAVPEPLRQRLAVASAQVAAQRQALARATAALDRAIDVLIPANGPTYGAGGSGARSSASGSLVA